MGEIYGLCLVNNLFYGEVHKLALNYVVDCLKNYDENMRLFGIEAISRYLENNLDLTTINKILEIQILI